VNITWYRDTPTRRYFFRTSILIFVFLSMMQITTWIPLRYWKIWGGGGFVDIGQLLHWGDCYNEYGIQVYGDVTSETLGYCGGYIYPRQVVQFIDLLNLARIDVKFFGFIMMLLLSFILAYVLQNLRKISLAAVSIVISPPILLIADRANVDILITVLALIAAFALNRSYFYLAVILLFFTVLIKFYTLPTLFVFFLYAKNMKKKLFLVLMIVFAFILIRKDLTFVSNLLGNENERQFGINVWSSYLCDYNLFKPFATYLPVIDYLIFFLCICFVLYFQHNKELNLIEIGQTLDIKKNAVLTLFATISITVFIAGTSVDYRLLLLIIPTSVLINNSIFIFRAKELFVLLLVCLWLSFPSGGLEPIGDLAVEILVAVLTLIMVGVLKSHIRSLNVLTRIRN
jgi:hypothetical protein